MATTGSYSTPTAMKMIQCAYVGPKADLVFTARLNYKEPMEQKKPDSMQQFEDEWNENQAKQEPEPDYPKDVEVQRPDPVKFGIHLETMRKNGASKEELQEAVDAYRYATNKANNAMMRRDDVPYPTQEEINKHYVDSAKDVPMSQALEELQELLDKLEKEAKEKAPSSIQVEDLSAVAHKYLSASARHDLSQKAYQSTVLENGRFFNPIYLATRVIKGDEERAVQYLAKVLNDLSQRGLIHSTLAPISSIELALSSSVKTSGVFCFVLIPSESHKDVQNMYPEFVIQEGDVGRELYDLSPILSPGEFTTTIRISQAMNMLQSQTKDPHAHFQKELDQYIALLPEGTRVRKVVQLAVTGLSFDFEVKFYNELLPNVKKVEIQYMRAVTPVGESLKQFHVITGVNYYDKDGNHLYK